MLFKELAWPMIQMSPRFALEPHRAGGGQTSAARGLARAARLIAALSVLFGSVVALSKPAFAYIDPGTGSLVIQAVLAAVLTVGATVKVFWHQIKEKYRNLFHKDEPEN